MDGLLLPERKRMLRSQLLQKRRQFSVDIIDQKSKEMVEFICSFPLYQASKTIMVYIAMSDEPKLDALIYHAWSVGKKVCLPVLRSNQPGFMDATYFHAFEDLESGPFGLFIPKLGKISLVNPNEIDLVVVPGVGFDHNGSRLGFGGGYYDRFLPLASKAVRMGAVWQKCIVDCIPTDGYDQAVEYVTAETGILKCEKGKM